MQRALELAHLGLRTVSPNPMVGCVIVHNDSIIGEGWHRKYGESHAEVNAINDVKNKELIKESTVYVTLEPCAHQGKTPPCADLLINQQVKKVVICNVDPNPLVNKGGIAKLRAAGIEVVNDVLSDFGEELNKRFFTFHRKSRPYIILKWAQTSDGFIARKNYDSKWISNEYSRRLVHQWRADEDAILVGTNTAHHDNPQLNVRGVEGRDPMRIVIDANLKLQPDLHLFDQSLPTICYNQKKVETNGNLEYVKISDTSISHIIADLTNRNTLSLLVEGGAEILKSFIKENLWDEARVFTSSQNFGEGIQAPKITGMTIQKEDIQGDILEIIKR